MIYVECKPDGVLVRHVTDLSRRQVRHEIQGKGAVCNRLKKNTDLLAMIDEDPGKTQPTYMAQLSLSREIAHLGLKLYLDRRRNNRVIVLCPRLEEWLLRATTDLELNIENYGLPRRAKAFHDAINLDERKIQRLLTDLTDGASPRLLELHRLLTA